jgi:PKD repeat protein
MHRLHVRDFGTYRSMVANHTVEARPGVLGIRWYEFRNTGGNWFLHQSGTFSPDNDDRWMGSISINANGDIALGYSRSSLSMFPSIYFTGQTADQSGSGMMNVAETLIQAGGGSQSGASRWGDYSRMTVDPSDDSFWYTTEYYAETASFDFKTRIANFTLDGGGSGGNNPPVASFTSDCSGLSCDFTDTSSDSDGSVVSWSWDFGDGTTSTAQNPSHEYASSNTYTVALTVTDNDGDSDTATGDVTVTGGQTTPTVQVAALVLERVRQSGPLRTARATVTVQDQNGNPVSGATVTGTFSGPISETSDPKATGGDGRVEISSDGTFTNSEFSSLSFCVNSIAADGYTYVASNTNPSWDCGAGKGIAGTQALASQTPKGFMLEQNYPNPFNPATIINYTLDEGTPVTLKVYNVLGKEVATLVDAYQEAGAHRVGFNAEALSAGVYLYVLQAGSYTQSRRMTLLK